MIFKSRQSSFYVTSMFVPNCHANLLDLFLQTLKSIVFFLNFLYPFKNLHCCYNSQNFCLGYYIEKEYLSTLRS